eukprot:TRINITY_DN88_c0_g2_i1.p1 TRINITY_DN88_c0_g2~~TRINITY_DN88_c0_g2_i1.p1  ORF type:complete len:1049 (+),score=148.56 TRINITY_DN88_c0_g2_i1:203-3349(+)
MRCKHILLYACVVTTLLGLTSAATSAFVDAGSQFDVAVDAPKYFTPATFTATDNFLGSVFRAGRAGTDFTYSFDLEPGGYNVVLGFAEYVDDFCAKGERVFNVYVNDEIQLEALDVFDSAAGCLIGWETTITATVSSVQTSPLTIRFESVMNPAMISIISVSSSATGCVPVSDSGAFADGEDHAAHSVPGSYPPQLNANSPKSFVDLDADGFEAVFIDGGGSHTHFFDSANNIIGRLTDFTWTIVETGQVISKTESFYYNFPLGTTRLKLAVIDDSCTTDEAETTVTVTGAIQQGMYCYYYEGLPKIIGNDPLGKPQFAAVSSAPNLGFPDFPFSDSQFVARCFFFLEIDQSVEEAAVSLSAGGGVARVYKGEDLLLDTEGMSSSDTELAVGLLGLEIIYEHTAPAQTAAVQFKVQGSVPAASKVFYDQSQVLPILSALSPSDGTDAGGTSVKVSGYGLFQPLTVTFGGQTVSVGGQVTPSQFFVTSPPAGSGPDAEVTVTTPGGLTSNSLSFSYGSTCESVGFDNVEMKTQSGGPVDFLQQPTSVAVGGDGKLYMGTTGSTVQVLGYNAQSLVVTSHCYSKPILDNSITKGSVPSPRDILGIALDPRDKAPRPYVSTSTLFWFARNRVDTSNTAAWRNGAIERLKPGTDPSDSDVCLVFDRRIVTGLPVANFDHSINNIVFTQDGDLLIAVGSFTNAGLPHYRAGNYWETTLSAAVLIAKLSKGGSFDGAIKYSNADIPELSQQTSGDVEIYSTGHRNTFGMTMARSGNVFAVDQGPNCDFGNTATACDEFDEEENASYDRDGDTAWPGRVQHGCERAPFSITRPDKILHVTKGSFYGHPNLQRGGSECAWIDAFDDMTADGKSAPSTYKGPLGTVRSSVTGIGEYGGNHFCGNLRGNIIMSTYTGGSIYRMGVNGGSRTSGPDSFTVGGGLSFVENQLGDLVFPKFDEKKVEVLRPRVAPKSGVYLANAVPWRHGRGGGTSVIIGGQNLGDTPSVTVGGSACTVTSSSGTEITCTVPAAGPGLKDIVVSSGGSSATLPKALLYMNA